MQTLAIPFVTRNPTIRAERYILTITLRNGNERMYLTDWPDAEEHLRNYGGVKAVIETRNGRYVASATEEEIYKEAAHDER